MSLLKNKISLKLLLILIFSLLGLSARADSIMTTVKPMAMIIAAVTPPTIDVHYLVRDGHSGHHYHMRPSDRLLLKDSDYFFWLGPDLEPIMATAAKHPNSIDLSNLLDEKPELTKGGSHLWMNPIEAVALAGSVADVLSKAYPQDSALIEQRLAAFSVAIKHIDDDLKRQIASLSNRDFIALHDGYGSLVSHYQLNQLAAFYGENEQMIGASSRLALKQEVADRDKVCVLTQPQFNLKPVKSLLAADHELDFVSIDPLAMSSDMTSYEVFMKDVATKLVQCLQP